jgi:hypothetical protein
MPLPISSALMEIFMNQSVNRKNTSDLVNKLNGTERALLKYFVLRSL